MNKGTQVASLRNVEPNSRFTSRMGSRVSPSRPVGGKTQEPGRYHSRVGTQTMVKLPAYGRPGPDNGRGLAR